MVEGVSEDELASELELELELGLELELELKLEVVLVLVVLELLMVPTTYCRFLMMLDPCSCCSSCRLPSPRGRG